MPQVTALCYVFSMIAESKHNITCLQSMHNMDSIHALPDHRLCWLPNMCVSLQGKGNAAARDAPSSLDLPADNSVAAHKQPSRKQAAAAVMAAQSTARGTGRSRGRGRQHGTNAGGITGTGRGAKPPAPARAVASNTRATRSLRGNLTAHKQKIVSDSEHSSKSD